MAARFDYQSIFQEESWTKVFSNAEGKDDEFYKLVISEFEFLILYSFSLIVLYTVLTPFLTQIVYY